ncbi:hypothetical protein NUW58_g9911 [Xylaria curta]|uniref:Uncharacterized protein n=1 Tax=Xylaria curta TaxID=42375 RepID=A0ACC1MU02_9PEZI|nr:hypothetical protein NUW58_g9911 [Xylaria curta]
MDQLLAVSAQHLSTVHPTLRDHYRCLGTVLQTRALDGFKTATAGSPRRNIVARFLFSSLIALSTMAAMAMSSRHEIDQLLPRFFEFLRITQGVRIVAGSAWAELYQSELGWIFNSFENLDEYNEPLPASLLGIIRMLERSNLDAATKDIYSKAAQFLGFVKKQLNSPTSWGVHAVMAWPNLVDSMYLQLLAGSRPEALLVLAHYAVLLHQHRRFWVFMDLGENFIMSISRTVEERWLTYLVEPLGALSDRPNGQVVQ